MGTAGLKGKLSMKPQTLFIPFTFSGVPDLTRRLMSLQQNLSTGNKSESPESEHIKEFDILNLPSGQ